MLIVVHLSILARPSLFAFFADIHGHWACLHENLAVIEEVEAVCLVESVDLSSKRQLVVVELAHIGNWPGWLDPVSLELGKSGVPVQSLLESLRSMRVQHLEVVVSEF